MIDGGVLGGGGVLFMLVFRLITPFLHSPGGGEGARFCKLRRNKTARCLLLGSWTVGQ